MTMSFDLFLLMYYSPLFALSQANDEEISDDTFMNNDTGIYTAHTHTQRERERDGI